MGNKKIVWFFLILLIVSSCGKDQMTTDDELIQEYINANGLSPKSFESGLYIIIEEEGGEEKPTIESEVELHYEGRYLTDELVFDSSYERGKTIRFPLSEFIPGWREGVPEFGEGGQGTLIIPSHLGYGSNPPSGIRSDAILIFDIELINFD